MMTKEVHTYILREQFDGQIEPIFHMQWKYYYPNYSSV